MSGVSPTKVSTYQDCKRKYLLKYVYKLGEKQSDNAKRGDSAHKVSERALLEGRPPPDDPIGRIAAVYLDQLPPMNPGIRVEHPFALQTYPGGPALYGKIDHIDVPEAVVTDLKTVKSFFFVKTPIELLADAQMVSYAVEAHRLNPRAREIVVRHVNVMAESKKRIPPSLVVPVIFDPRRLLSEWRGIVHQVWEMRELELARPDPLLVEPSPQACRKYGGCPFRQTCGYADDKPIGGHDMTLTLEEMRKMQMQNGSNGVTVPPGYYLPDGHQLVPGYNPPAMQRISDGAIFALPPSNVVPITPPQHQPPPQAAPSQQPQLPPGYIMGGTVNHLVPPGRYVPAGFTPMDADHTGPRMIDANGKVFGQPFIEQAPQSPPTVSHASPAPGAGFAPPMPPAQPLPPIAAPSPQQVASPATVPITPPPAQQAAPPVAMQQQPAPAAQQQAPAAQQQAPAAQQQPAPAAGPGRPRKKKTDAAPGAAAAEGPEPLELWVDVLPRKGYPEGATTLEEWMLPALDRARQLAGQDWRAVDFDKGKASLFQALAEHAKASPPTGVVLVRTALAGSDVAIEVLTPYAARVIEPSAAAGGRR